MKNMPKITEMIMEDKISPEFRSVVLKTFDSYFKAHITLTKLQDAGIECYLLNENLASLSPGHANMYGDIKLVIKDTDAEEAVRLMKQFDDEFVNAVKCPICRQNKIVQILKPGPKSYFKRVLIGLFLGLPAADEYVYHCENCGWESKSLPDEDDD